MASGNLHMVRTINRRGNYSMLMGIMVFVILGFAAMAVDVSLMTMSQVQAQGVADAASHAAMVGYRQNRDPAEGDEAAQFMFDNNPVGLGTADMSVMEFGKWEDGGFTKSDDVDLINAARVTADRTSAKSNAVQLLIAPVLGVNEYEPSADSITAHQTRNIMIVQDMSGSFSEEINFARNANLAFLGYMDAHQQPGDMLGLTMYGERVAQEMYTNCTTTFTTPNDCPVRPGLDAIGGYSSTYSDGTDYGTPWIPLTVIENQSGFDDLAKGMMGICDAEVAWDSDTTPRGMCTSSAGYSRGDGFSSGSQYGPSPAPRYGGSKGMGGWTCTAGGVKQAADQLIDEGNADAFKAIVLITDGEPNACGNASIVENALDYAEENDIHVWVVAFEDDDSSFNGDVLDDWWRGVGTFEKTDPNDNSSLEEIMLDIASSMPIVLVK